MSILICTVHADHAYLCADTDCTLPGGSRRRASKLLPLVHANAALAARGSAGFMSAVFLRCLHWGAADIEGLHDRMEGVLIDAAAEIVVSGVTYLDEKAGLDGRQEIYLVGWSKRLNRPIARAYQGDIATGIFTRTDIDVGSFAVAPATWDQKTGGAPPLENVGDMMRLARAQVALIRKESPHCAAGGDFIVAKIERDRMTVSRECDLDGGAS